MTPPAATSTSLSDSVGWHEAECASYAADLPVWRELAAGCDGAVCDLGCGTGRVAIDLAWREHRVLAVDRDPELLAALRDRSAGLAVRTLLGDVLDLSLPEPVTLAIAPMQLVQLLDGKAERARLLHRLRANLEPGGRAALAIVERRDVELAGSGPGFGPRGPEPDVYEIAARRYESTPVRVDVEDDDLIVQRRRRCLVAGELPREESFTVALRALEAGVVEQEARATGLRPAGRRRVAPTPAHVGSTVIVLEAPAR